MWLGAFAREGADGAVGELLMRCLYTGSVDGPGGIPSREFWTHYLKVEFRAQSALEHVYLALAVDGVR